jgi:hypothetical protein
MFGMFGTRYLLLLYSSEQRLAHCFLALIMKTFLTLFSLSLAWLAPCTHAYGIDSSCGDQALIQVAADSAIDMAAKALDAIEPPDGAPRDQNVERLLNLLFRGPTPLSKDDDGLLLRRIAKVFLGVTKFAGKTNMVQPDNDPTTADGVVCISSDLGVCKAEVDRTSIAI